MNKLMAVSCFLIVPAFGLLAQGPPPRGAGFGPMGGRFMGMMGGPQPLVTGAPYSAVEVVQQQETLADGNSIVHNRQSNVYRDSSGRVRTEETITPPASSGKQPYTMATILDFVGGHRYVLDSSTMTAYESPLHAPPAPGQGAANAMARRGGVQSDAARPNNSANPNVVRTTLSPQSVNGVMASGTQHVETIPAGAIGNARAIQTTRVTWISTDLKVPVQIKSTDPRFGATDMELTNIVQAEPNASLFTVPAGYTVKTGGPGGMRGPRGPRGGTQTQ
ncbi:MAG TPA: hypothetical protein VKB79_19915 [Bryobacteraceae bacterium]|nr:hypothetical protein [Bryobacteraceae bacterium]